MIKAKFIIIPFWRALKRKSRNICHLLPDDVIEMEHEVVSKLHHTMHNQAVSSDVASVLMSLTSPLRHILHKLGKLPIVLGRSEMFQAPYTEQKNSMLRTVLQRRLRTVVTMRSSIYVADLHIQKQSYIIYIHKIQ